MSDVGRAWLESRTAEAPPVLRARVREHAAEVTTPDDIAEAARRALAAVLDHPGDRSVALDLLSADGLVTLALLAQAEIAPEQLDAFARMTMARSIDRSPQSS